MEEMNEKSGFYAAVLFVIWPVLAVASAFRNYKSSWAKNILWCFVAFYGFCFAIGEGNKGSDINRYVDELKQLHTVELTIPGAIEYFEDSGEIDVLRTFIAVSLSRITDSQAVLTLVFGIIFGFFFSRNIWYVLDRLEGKLQPITILLLICLLLTIPIWSINGFRMWTAAQMFIYGLLPFLFEGKKDRIFFAFASIMVHFSFIVPVGILMAYLVLGNRLVFYFSFFVLTLFVSEINLDAFNNIIESYAPEVVQERTSSYRSEKIVDEYREGPEEKIVWYAIWYRKALHWSLMGFFTVLFFKGKSFFNQNKGWLNLFCFALLIYGATNLLSSLPSGGRYYSLASFFALTLIVLYVQNRKHDAVMRNFILAATPALLLFVIVAVRVGFYSISATAVLGNPIIAFFLTDSHLSLNDFMKSLL